MRNRLHLWKWHRAFTKIDASLAAAGAMRVGHFGLATARLIDAPRLANAILPYLQQDPLYLLTEDARQEFQHSREHDKPEMRMGDRAMERIP